MQDYYKTAEFFVIGSATSIKIILAPNHLQLLRLVTEAKTSIQKLTAEIRENGNFFFIQKLKLATQPSKPQKTLIAISAALATGFALLMFVFIKWALVNASS